MSWYQLSFATLPEAAPLEGVSHSASRQGWHKDRNPREQFFTIRKTYKQNIFVISNQQLVASNNCHMLQKRMIVSNVYMYLKLICMNINNMYIYIYIQTYMLTPYKNPPCLLFPRFIAMSMCIYVHIYTCIYMYVYHIYLYMHYHIHIVFVTLLQPPNQRHQSSKARLRPRSPGCSRPSLVLTESRLTVDSIGGPSI